MKIHSDMGHESGEPNPEDADFARQLGDILRTTESPRPGFEARVRAAIQASHDQQAVPSAATVLRLQPRTPRLTSWRERRSFALPLLGWGGLAAGFAAIVSLGTLSVARSGDRTPRSAENAGIAAQTTHQTAASPSRDTVYVVRFVLADTRARTVSLVGDFNAWARHATPLVAVKPGVWSAQVPLRAGRHEYAFVVDGKHWVVDPASESRADEFDTPSSIVTVGSD